MTEVPAAGDQLPAARWYSSITCAASNPSSFEAGQRHLGEPLQPLPLRRRATAQDVCHHHEAHPGPDQIASHLAERRPLGHDVEREDFHGRPYSSQADVTRQLHGARRSASKPCELL